MPIITLPTIVKNALDEFLASLFNNEPKRKHIANYITGLMIAENKTISGITNTVFTNRGQTPPTNHVSIDFSPKSNGTNKP